MNNKVFINCPFDEEYESLLKPLLFTLLYLDFIPVISQTVSSSNSRLNQIIKLINSTSFSIHDLSRSKPLKINDLPRFNMPFELGLDIAYNKFNGSKKKILILETKRFYYQKVLSDIAGQDIESHSDDPRTLLRNVRAWFARIKKNNNYVGPTTIWTAYNQFESDLLIRAGKEGFSKSEIRRMPKADYMKFAKDWIKEFKV